MHFFRLLNSHPIKDNIINFNKKIEIENKNKITLHKI